MTIPSEQSPDWSSLWPRHLEQYWAAPPRLAYWLLQRYSGPQVSLELGAGSCRDSFCLSRMGWHATAIDSNHEVINAVRERFRHPRFVVRQGDAFDLPFPGKSFTLSFSNGFWGLFNDDQILRLLSEQRRVTSRVLVAAVHNAENKALQALFARKAREDGLYDIRFFRRQELQILLQRAGMEAGRIRFHKFGTAADRLYSRRFAFLFSRISPRIVPHLYRLAPWHKVERIICEIILQPDMPAG